MYLLCFGISFDKSKFKYSSSLTICCMRIMLVSNGHFYLQLGVVANPDIHSFDLTEREHFLILGCDGLWGVCIYIFTVSIFTMTHLFLWKSFWAASVAASIIYHNFNISEVLLWHLLGFWTKWCCSICSETFKCKCVSLTNELWEKYYSRKSMP